MKTLIIIYGIRIRNNKYIYQYRNIEMTALDIAVIEEDEQNSIVLQCIELNVLIYY